MGFTNSPLVVHTNISPNKTKNRNHAIDTITIHCVVGQCTAESLGAWFAKSSTQASSNYGVDKDGRVGLYVEEKDRSWCTSSSSNDHRAITIEVASDTKHPYAVTDKAYEALIELVADICKRNGIKKLLWKADKSLLGQPDKQNMTVHRWFANKSCPGEYLYSRHGEIAERVNKLLGVDEEQTTLETEQTVRSFKAGDVVKITGERYYNGKFVPAWVKNKNWIVHANSSGDRVVVNKSEDGTNAIMSPFNTRDIELAYKKEAYSGTPSTGADADIKKIWEFLLNKIGNPYGVAGLMGNLKAESALRSNNLQQTYEKKLGFTDVSYTSAVDNGSYTNFVKDSAGYGLAQWTYWSRKEALYNYAQSVKKSISDFDMQLEFLWKELSESYKSVVNTLKSAKSVREASDAVLTKFERPADQSETVQLKRAGYGEEFYKTFVPEEFKPYLVRVKIKDLNIRKGPGTNYPTIGCFTGIGVFTIVDEADGPGASKWGLLKSYSKNRNGWVSLDYAKKI